MSFGIEQTVECLRAVGEPTRLRILLLLAKGELSVLELCRILDQSQPRVSRHLKLLVEAGIVDRFPDGAWVFHRLANPGPMDDLVQTILRPGHTDDPLVLRDSDRLREIQAERVNEAQLYFARNAARWDEIRRLYAPEDQVNQAIIDALVRPRFDFYVDLGAGTGAMLTLLAPRAARSIGLDLSQQMLNIARSNVEAAGLATCELRHGDIFDTRIAAGSIDLVSVHQVLHFLSDPGAAVAQAAKLVGRGGQLLVVDFAQHRLEFLREQNQHRRLGFSDQEIGRWMTQAGLNCHEPLSLRPQTEDGLTIKIWSGLRPVLD
jgi:ubiquinone/menaquinone biosynthesis C-methylase UbiE/DNA-binding transcriptional ArsR family regulator